MTSTHDRSVGAAGVPIVVWALVALTAAAMVLFVALSPVNGNGDSLVVIAGSHIATDCLGDGTLRSCGATIGPYPLAQYVLSALLVGLGASDPQVLRWFGLVSAMAFVAVLALTATTFRRSGRTPIVALALFVVLASPLPYYAWSTFGESLGALLCAGFVAAAALRAHPALLGLALVAAGQTKETAMPFLVVLGAALLLWSTIGGRSTRRGHWIGLGVGAIVSLAVTAGFNEFRFGQLTNLVYADPIAHVPTLDLKLKYAVSIWAAPNAGVAPFWPAVTMVIVAMFLAMWLGRRPSSDRSRLLGAGAAVLLVLLGLTGGYASWYAPFGWVAWGPRLMLLMLPAILIAVLALFAPELERMLATRSRWGARLLLAGAVVAVLGTLPHLGILQRPEVLATIFAPDATCPVQQPIGADPGYYYTCIFHWAWWKHWYLPDATAGIGDSVWSIAMTALWVTTLVALAVTARRTALVRAATTADDAAGAAATLRAADHAVAP